MFPSMLSADRTGVRGKRQRGQSLVEFAISSIVLLLLAMGLLDLSRAFYYAVNLEGAAREGARHAAWFNTAQRVNPYLDDGEVTSAVNAALSGAGLVGIPKPQAGCLTPSDGNGAGNKPYATSAYPTTPQTVFIYFCYTFPGGGTQTGTMGAPPGDNSWKLGDVDVILLMNFRLITPFIQNLFGTGIDLAYNEHFTIQGKP